MKYPEFCDRPAPAPYLRCISACGIAWLLVLGLCLAPAASAQSPHSAGQWQPPPPPASWPDAMHHGYMDGIDAAWLDLSTGLAPKPSRHLDYRNPPNVKIDHRYRYREGFRRGYQAVYRHNRKVHPNHPDYAGTH